MITVRLVGGASGVAYNINGYDATRVDWFVDESVPLQERIRSDSITMMEVEIAGEWVSLADALADGRVRANPANGDLTDE